MLCIPKLLLRPTTAAFLLNAPLLVACDGSSSQISQTASGPGDAGPADAGANRADASRSLSDLSLDELGLVQSRAAEVLLGDEFQVAVCRFNSVNTEPGDANTSCEEAMRQCVPAPVDADAGILSDQGLLIPGDVTLNLGESATNSCDLPVSKLDACIGELATVYLGLAADVDCASDAGAPEIAPLALLGARSCISIAVSCPQLLELAGGLGN